MIELKVGEHTLSLYNAAEELPIKRYSKFQKYMLIETGVGSDLESIGKHFSKLFAFLGQKLVPESFQETKNLYYNFFMLLEEINIPGIAFTCLVHSIDGKEINDLSEDNLKQATEQLSLLGVTQATVQEWNDLVKKKFIMN